MLLFLDESVSQRDGDITTTFKVNAHRYIFSYRDHFDQRLDNLHTPSLLEQGDSKILRDIICNTKSLFTESGIPRLARARARARTPSSAGAKCRYRWTMLHPEAHLDVSHSYIEESPLPSCTGSWCAGASRPP